MKYLVVKRFALDDVPVLLTDDFTEAEQEVKDIEVEIEAHPVFATDAEQQLMEADIGTELIGAGIITFGDDGRPVVSSIINRK